MGSDDTKNTIVCPKCGKSAVSLEYISSGFRRYARYTHRSGPAESIFVQTCYVRVNEGEAKDKESIANLSKNKEDFLDY